MEFRLLQDDEFCPHADISTLRFFFTPRHTPPSSASTSSLRTPRFSHPRHHSLPRQPLHLPHSRPPHLIPLHTSHCSSLTHDFPTSFPTTPATPPPSPTSSPLHSPPRLSLLLPHPLLPHFIPLHACHSSLTHDFPTSFSFLTHTSLLKPRHAKLSAPIFPAIPLR